MFKPGLKSVASMFVAAIFALPAFASNADANSAVPGSLNYVEGQVRMGAQSLDSKAIGTAELQTGESLTTVKGKAEVLLTSGVFLRVGANSSVRMISPSLTDTELAVDKGHAIIEVTDIYKQNDIRISEDGATTRLLNTGLYDFDLRQNQLRVFDGKARVEDGGKSVTVKSGRELDLAQNSSLKARKFKREPYEEGDLYRWSSLRSAYLAEANVDAANMYAANMWGSWGGADWCWDPWFDAYTFVPGDGIFYSPFGWGFYSPWLAFEAPFYGFGYGYGRRFHQFSANYHNWGFRSPYVASGRYSHGIYHGPGSTGTGFHSGPQMAGVRSPEGFGGGGFRGAGGGFHGGGGGFHGSGGGGGHR